MDDKVLPLLALAVAVLILVILSRKGGWRREVVSKPSIPFSELSPVLEGAVVTTLNTSKQVPAGHCIEFLTPKGIITYRRHTEEDGIAEIVDVVVHGYVGVIFTLHNGRIMALEWIGSGSVIHDPHLSNDDYHHVSRFVQQVRRLDRAHMGN